MVKKNAEQEKEEEKKLTSQCYCEWAASTRAK